MQVGILKEVKTKENRVAMTPAGVEQMIEHGHTVGVETTAGEGSGFSDRQYEKAGAKIVGTAQKIYAQSDMVMKVKEPLPVEYRLIRSIKEKSVMELILQISRLILCTIITG